MEDVIGHVSLDGRMLHAVVNPDGEVGADTVFEFHEKGPVVHARYAGGTIELGVLVGIREGFSVRFRYVHLTTTGETASGRSEDTIEVLRDGRIRLHENWRWESQPGSGSSVLEEI